MGFLVKNSENNLCILLYITTYFLSCKCVNSMYKISDCCNRAKCKKVNSIVLIHCNWMFCQFFFHVFHIFFSFRYMRAGSHHDTNIFERKVSINNKFFCYVFDDDDCPIINFL